MRELLLERLEHIEVPGEGEVGMKTRDDMEFAHSFSSRPGLVHDILDGHFIRPRFSFAPAESAEFAAVDTDVRRIDVHVLDEVYVITVFLPGNVACHVSEREEIVRLKERNAVATGQTCTGMNFFFDFIDSHNQG